MFRVGPLPQREIFRIALLAAHRFARPGFLFLQPPVGQLAVVGVGADIEIDAAVRLVGVALVDERRDHFDLFRDVSAGARRNAGPPHAQRVHGIEIAFGVGLDDLHGPRLRLRRLAQDAVFAAVEQVAHVGDVLYIQHIEARRAQEAHERIESDVGFGVPDMRVVVDCWPAHIHGNLAGHERHKLLHLAAQHIEESQRHLVSFIPFSRRPL
jgi:hypothetical protein